MESIDDQPFWYRVVRNIWSCLMQGGGNVIGAEVTVIGAMATFEQQRGPKEVSFRHGLHPELSSTRNSVKVSYFSRNLS